VLSCCYNFILLKCPTTDDEFYISGLFNNLFFFHPVWLFFRHGLAFFLKSEEMSGNPDVGSCEQLLQYFLIYVAYSADMVFADVI